MYLDWHISDLTWNRLVTVVCFMVLFSAIILNNKSLKEWFAKKIGKKEIFNGHAKINQVIHADIFSFQASLVLNADGYIVSANKRTQKLFGWHEEELIGNKIDKIITQDCIAGFEAHKKEFSVSLSDEEIKELEVDAMTRIEEKKILRVIVGKWTDDLDIYFTVSMLDVTHRKKTEAAIKVAEAEINLTRQIYHEGEKVGNVAFWKMDCQTGRLQYSPNYANMFALKGVQVFYEELIRRIIAEDRVKVVETMNRAKEAKTGYDIEYRFAGMDGYINTMYSTAKAVKNNAGELTHFIGMSRLIKKEKPIWL